MKTIEMREYMIKFFMKQVWYIFVTTIVMLVLFPLMSITADASDSEWLSDYQYSVRGNSVVLTKYTGAGGDLVIPGSAEINGNIYQVVINAQGSGENAFFPEDNISSLCFGYGCKAESLNAFVFLKENLTSLDLANLDTSEVTNFNAAFARLSSITEIKNLNQINTKSATKMTEMFGDDDKLTSIDLSSFDTENVTDMSWMFKGCSSLEQIDVSGFNTANVENMCSMFEDCSSLKNLDISNFNTEKLNDYQGGYNSVERVHHNCDFDGITHMFSGCRSLESLNLGDFHTENIGFFMGMFRGCSSLRTLDVSSFDMREAISVQNMFYGCSSLESLDLSGWDMRNCTDLEDGSRDSKNMLYRCYNLKTIDTPTNLPKEGILLENGKVYTDEAGTIYTTLPTNCSSSIRLFHNPTIAGIRNFVTRLYQVGLEREPEEEGLNNWTNQLISGEKNAVDIVQGVLCSPEYLNKGKSNSYMVNDCYRAMLNRSADHSGWNDWVTRLDAGMSINAIFAGFVGSQEFINLCSQYNINPGSFPITEERDKNAGVTMFVSRLYTKALGRNYDIAGLNDWCGRINANPSRDNIMNVATNGFFHSSEFLNKDLNNTEFVKVLYRTYLGREYDRAGLSDWVNQLNRGEKTRDQVIEGFAYSQEFSNIMASYGL